MGTLHGDVNRRQEREGDQNTEGTYLRSNMIAGDMVYTGGWIDPAKEELKALSQTWRLVGRREDGRKWIQLADMRQGRATHGCVADTYKVLYAKKRDSGVQRKVNSMFLNEGLRDIAPASCLYLTAGSSSRHLVHFKKSWHLHRIVFVH